MTPTTMPYQALTEPEGLPGRAWSTVDAGARAVVVPADVAARVDAMRTVAKAEASRSDAMVAVKNVAPQLDAATKPAQSSARAALAELSNLQGHLRTAADRHGLEVWTEAYVAQARAASKAAAAEWRGRFDDMLAKAERDAEARMVAASGTRASPAAENWARMHAAHVAALTPGRAVEAMLDLASDVAAGRAKPDQARAILPALASKLETDAAWDTAPVRQALDVLAVAGRDLEWHAAHESLNAVRAARAKLPLFVELWHDESELGDLAAWRRDRQAVVRSGDLTYAPNLSADGEAVPALPPAKVLGAKNPFFAEFAA